MTNTEKELLQAKKDNDSLEIELFLLRFEIAKLLEDMDQENK